MKLQIKAVGMDMTDSVRTYVTEKIGGLERLIVEGHREAALADVKLIYKPSDTEDTKDKCHVTISGLGRGDAIHVEEEAEDMHVAIDRVAHVLKETLRRHEDKYRDHMHKGARELKEQAQTFDPGESDQA